MQNYYTSVRAFEFSKKVEFEGVTASPIPRSERDFPRVRRAAANRRDYASHAALPRISSYRVEIPRTTRRSKQYSEGTRSASIFGVRNFSRNSRNIFVNVINIHAYVIKVAIREHNYSIERRGSIFAAYIAITWRVRERP